MKYEEFEAEIFHLIGIDLMLYKEKQMKRRINTLIARLGLDGYDSYLELLRSDPVSLRYFKDYITINVTEFFRTQEQWNFMADTVLPQLPDDAVIWSCACSTGEEAYSLAISIAERRPLANIRIIATDIDDEVLDVARKGVYTPRTMNNVYHANIDKYFTPIDPSAVSDKNYFRINDDIRRHVEFRKLNLLASQSDSTENLFPQNCSLIACRNVLIYFTDEAKHMLYRRFSDSLRPGGYLFTGHTEQLLHYRDYNFTKLKGFLLKKN